MDKFTSIRSGEVIINPDFECDEYVLQCMEDGIKFDGGWFKEHQYVLIKCCKYRPSSTFFHNELGSNCQLFTNLSIDKERLLGILGVSTFGSWPSTGNETTRYNFFTMMYYAGVSPIFLEFLKELTQKPGNFTIEYIFKEGIRRLREKLDELMPIDAKNTTFKEIRENAIKFMKANDPLEKEEPKSVIGHIWFDGKNEEVIVLDGYYRCGVFICPSVEELIEQVIRKNIKTGEFPDFTKGVIFEKDTYKTYQGINFFLERKGKGPAINVLQKIQISQNDIADCIGKKERTGQFFEYPEPDYRFYFTLLYYSYISKRFRDVFANFVKTSKAANAADLYHQVTNLFINPKTTSNGKLFETTARVAIRGDHYEGTAISGKACFKPLRG